MAEKREIEISLKSNKAEASADKLNRKVKGIGAAADSAESSISKLTKVAAAVGTALVTSQITRYADAYTSLQNQVRQTTKSTEELTQRTKDLLEISNRSRAGISSTSELYTQLVLSTENLNLSTEEQLRLTETITKSFAVSGKSAADAAGSIRQLGQAFASGTLRGDEFNSIAEGAPEIMRALQRSLKLTQGELRDLAATGGITAKILVDALGEAASTIDTKFNNSTATMAQNLEVANNNLTEFIGSNTTVKNVIGGLGGALVTSSENISTIASSAAVLASVFAARLVPSMIAYSASLASNTTAQLTNGTAAVRTVNIYGTVTVAAARATVATNALALASRLATGAMALLGGPLGIALIAATALYAFSDSVTDLNKKVSTATPEMDAFAASIEKMSRGAKGASLASINNEMAELRAELTETETKLANIKVQNSGGLYDKSTIEAANYRSKIKDINDQLDLLSEKQGIIIGAPDLSGGTNMGNINKTPKSDSIIAADTKAFDSLKARLQLETQAIQAEAEVRRAFAEGQINQRQLDEELALQGIYYNYEARRVVILENEKLTHDQKLQLLTELAQQEIDAEQIKQDQITGKTQEGADNRTDIAQQEASAIKGMLINTAVAAFNLTQNANQKMTKEQKSQAKKSIYIQTAAAIARAYGENNFYVASGMALFLAGMQLKQINAAESAGSSSVTSSAPSAIVQQAPSISNQSQSRTINITGLENFGPDDMIPVTRAQFESYLSESEGANIAINQGQSNAARIGAI